MPDDLRLPPQQALSLAQRYLDEGHPFQAHEVLEASWKSAPAADRDLWQGLAQLAVGLTHAQRGNATGAAALLRRGAGRIRGYLPGPAGPHGLDVAGIIQTADALAVKVERDGAASVSPADLRLQAAAG